MNEKNIIQQGTIAKYRVLVSREGFDMDTDDFAVRLSWGMMGRSMTIAKSDMQMGADGKWLFTMNTDGMVGAVTASMMIQVPDTDVQGGLMMEVDRQYLCFVVTTPNPKMLCIPKGSEHPTVTYERVMEPGSVWKYQYLCDSRTRRFVTRDNQYLAVLREYHKK